MKRIFIVLLTLFVNLCINSQEVKEVSRYWTSFAQSVEVASEATKKFKVVASVKAEIVDDKAWAGVWARVDNKPEQGRGFFDNMGNRPIKSKEWNTYVVQGVIDSKSEKLVFGGISSYNGKFFFDKFELYIEDDSGVFQLIPIKNASFEEQVEDNLISGWNPGISSGKVTKVREFTFNSTKDKVDGAYAVVIEGTGISKATGSMEGIFPNIGIVISLVLFCIVILCFMTYTSSVEDDKWSVFGRIGFRFSFIYFILVILFQNNGAYPFFSSLFIGVIKLSQKFVPWFGEHIIGIPFRINTGPNGSGDTSYDYLVIFIIFIIAILGTTVWSILDRKRTNYKKMYYWLSTAIRYYVGLMLISYGLVKVIQLQFPAPSFYRMLQPYGESSPMGLAWTFLGFSEGYNLFMGIAEVLAGLLLFRRTLTFGAIITLMTAMNVMAVNYFFDVPVKILSTHLVLMTSFLLLRDFRKVMEFFLTDKTVEKLSVIKRPDFNKPITISLNVIKGLILFYALGVGFYNALESKELYGRDLPKPPLYGVYEVNNFVVNGDTITNYKSEQLWKNIRFEKEGKAQVHTMNKKNIYYSVEVDTANQNIKFNPSSGTGSFNFKYILKGEELDFSFIHKQDTISGSSRKLGEDDFLLTNRGFHWISEYPFNR